MMIDLNKESCIACTKDSLQLNSREISDMCREIPGWDLIYQRDTPRLTRSFNFTDFDKAFYFVNEIVLLSQRENHHPRIILEWGKVTISWWTYIIKGLHRNDFIMAAKTSNLYK